MSFCYKIMSHYVTIINIMQDGIYVNEVSDQAAERHTTIPRIGQAAQVKDDMDRLIERYYEENTTAAKLVVKLAELCTNVVNIADASERKTAAQNFIKVCDT